MSITEYTGGNFPTYRFYVSELPSPSLTYEVFPLNFNESSLIDTLQSGQIFYRRTFNGPLLFGTNSIAIDEDGNEQNRQDDWDLFWGQEQHDPCASFYFHIHKTVGGVVDPATTPDAYWEGIFSTTDGTFDIDKCTFEVTPMPNDKYIDILESAEVQYNILNATTTVTVEAVQGTTDETYDNNRWLAKIGSNSVLEYLCNQVLTGVTVSSTFFTAATNPVTLSDNLLLHLTIAQKSDIKRPTDSNPAGTAMMSFNELMDILWSMFQVRWDYDDDTDTINVEHISWWDPGAGLDLRNQLMTQSTNKYTYTKSVMPKYEKFNFMEADNANFVGWPIWYDSDCVDTNPNTNTRETSINVTTDLDYIVRADDAISDDGFVILCNWFDDPDYKVLLSIGLINGNVLLNMAMSWANLQNSYFRHNRVLITGHLNNSEVTFWTAQKTKLQECSAILCDAYDPDDYITTELGVTHLNGAKAYVQRSELKPSGEIKFSLLYGPADNTPTAITEGKWILIYEDGCGELYATLSEDSGAGFNITVKYYVQDNTGAEHCDDGVGETWAVGAGVQTSSYDVQFTNCAGGAAAIAAGGCIAYYIATTVGDWTVYTYPDPACNC